jgi:hypothetical protein
VGLSTTSASVSISIYIGLGTAVTLIFAFSIRSISHMIEDADSAGALDSKMFVRALTTTQVQMRAAAL